MPLVSSAGPPRGELRLLLALAVPNVAGTAAETIMSFIDYAIVSALGSQAQAAVSCGGMVYFTIFAFLLGMMVCVTTVVSQSLGAHRPRDCSAYAWQGIWLSAAFGLAGLSLWPAVPGLYAWIGHEPAVQAMEVVYTQIRLLGIGLAGASVALGHFFNGVHRPRQNAQSVIGTAVLNAALSYGLVLGKWGLPAMGVPGAAWGTVLSNLVRVAWLMCAMLFSRATASFEARRSFAFDADKMRRLVRIGWPSGAAFVCDIAAWAVFLVVIIGQFGTHHLAATATCWRYTELSFMPAIGIGHAVCTLVGRSIGEGRPVLARRRALRGALLNMSYMGAMAAVFLVARYPLMRLFSREEAVVALGADLLVFVALFQLFDAVAINYSNALRGAGDTRWPAVVGSIQAWVLMVGGAALVAHLRPGWGSVGPWLVATFHVVLTGFVFAVRWRIGPWEKLDVIGRAPPVPAGVEGVPIDPLSLAPPPTAARGA